MLELEHWTQPLAESNCWMLAEGGRALVIDPNDPQGPLEVLERRGWEAELVLLTHEHCDHMSGTGALKKRFPAARVVASKACSEGLGSTRLNMSSMMEVYLAFRGKPGVSYPPFTCAPADVTYSQPLELAWRGHRLRCVPLPGHTPGSAGIFFDEELFFSGDYLIPREQVILRLPGGDRETYLAQTKPFLDALPAGLRVCPGHREAFVL